MSQQDGNEEKTGARRFWPAGRSGKALAVLTAAAITAGGLFGYQAMAQSNTYQHMRLAAADGWHHGWGRGHHGRLADLSDAEFEARIERMVRHVAIEIDASDEQEARLIELVSGAARQLRPLREEMRQTHQTMHDLLTAETIDREALDRLRAERLAEFDRVSKNLVETLADVAQVLTPEQRLLLDERIKEMRSHHRGRDRG